MSAKAGVKPLMQFCQRLEELYVFYVEAVTGFEMLAKFIDRQTNGPKAVTTLENRNFYGARGEGPTSPGSTFVRVTTLGETRARCAKGGPNNTALVQSILLTAYALWEHEARPELEKHVGEKIQNPAFGDLNKYRQAVAHVGGRLDNKTEIFQFIDVGQEITLTDDQLVDLMVLLASAANQISETYLGCSLEYEFLKSHNSANDTWVEITV